MIAAFSPGSDFKRYYRGRMPRLALVVILLMPLMYGALYLWAFWDPFGKVDKLPVAIVNLDQGATRDGQPVDAGTEVVKGLIDSGQLDLVETSEEQAEAGLAHGTYYFTITLPSDFSDAVVSAGTDEARPATLQFTYNDANNYLSTVIGQDAAEEVINQVSAQVGQQIFDNVVAAVKDSIPKIRSAVAGVDQLNTGMQTAHDGANELATNMVTAETGSTQLSSALDDLDQAVVGVTEKADAIIAGTGLTGAELREIAQGVDQDVTVVANALNLVNEANLRAESELQTIIDELAASDDETVVALAARLVSVQTSIQSSQIAQETLDLFETVRSDVNSIATDLGDPASLVNVVLTAVENGAIQTDLASVNTAATKLRDGADSLATGLTELTDGANTLAAGTTELLSGTQQLADAADSGIKLLPDWSEDEQGNFIKALAQPVQLKETVNNEAKTFAYGFAPFFFGLALFVGGIIAWMLFTPLQARPLAQGLGSFRVVLASYAPTLFVGLLQAVILFLVVYLPLGLHPVHAWGTLGFLLLMVAMFLAMIQMFNALFGPAVGRVLTLAFLMVQLTSAGGIYPVPTTSAPFQAMHWFDPMTYTVTGLRQLILGGVDNRLWTSIAVIVGLTAAFIAVSTWAARRNRQYNMDRLYPPVEV